MTAFEGGCHCGALDVQFRTALPVAQWNVRACQCGFCRAHGALTTSDPQGALAIHVHDAAMLQRYRFGLRTADFLLCARCGVYVGARIDTDRGPFGILNVRALREQPPDLPAALAAEYGAEGTAERILRRTARWTPIDAER